MSNVLIGIIGVILFIGLALAGALFLGPRFQESTNNSKAAAIMQGLKQTADAGNLYELNTGSQVAAGVAADSPVMNGYLKATPPNPVTNGGPVLFFDADGSSTSTGRAAFVAMSLKSLTNDKPICEAIQRTTGMITSSSPFDATNRELKLSTLVGVSGCILVNDRYWTYSRL